MLLHWIWFAGRAGIQDHQKAALMEHFYDAEDIFRADEDAYLCLDLLSREQIRPTCA